MFVSYCVSNIISPQFFKNDQAPLYPLGTGAILGSYILSLLTIGVYMFLCHWENKRRDARDAAANEVVHYDTDFKDLTDKQNLVRTSTCGRLIMADSPLALPICLVIWDVKRGLILGGNEFLDKLFILRSLLKQSSCERRSCSYIAVVSTCSHVEGLPRSSIWNSSLLDLLP